MEKSLFKFLPPEYVKQYIYQYVGYVKERRDGRLNGGCPFCQEGTSWGKKARFWYDPDREGDGKSCKCYNCGGNWGSAEFIHKMVGLSFKEIEVESNDYDIIPKELRENFNEEFIKEYKIEALPRDSINLMDSHQLRFYKDNDIVMSAVKYLNDRKVLTAPNRPKTFYISLTDFFHKNRIIIPYYEYDKIVWYQSRSFLPTNDNAPKYLSKKNAQKTLYNIDNIKADNPYIFVFEGAFKSMFTHNSTCSSGITEYNKHDNFLFTKKQAMQLQRYPLHEIIWILDSPYLDETAREKEKTILNLGYKLFKWPKELGKNFKDFDEIAVKTGKKISQDFIMRNLYKDDFVGKIENLLKSGH